jgi:hypothetical protein
MPTITVDKREMQGRLDKMAEDFAKHIAPVYKLLKWAWFGRKNGDYGMHIPDKKDIYLTVCDLINSLNDIEEGKEESFCSTGGIKVWYNNRGGCGIDFIAHSTFYGKRSDGSPIQNNFWKND